MRPETRTITAPVSASKRKGTIRRLNMIALISWQKSAGKPTPTSGGNRDEPDVTCPQGKDVAAQQA
jgi:hypothetical protein